jgi:DNA-binding winged helix-turn-helix (wHTH) protein
VPTAPTLYILAVLTERQGEVLSKEEIMDSGNVN